MARLPRFVIAIAIAACSGMRAGPTESLNDALQPIREKHGLPAIAAAVASDEKMLASGAVGVRNILSPPGNQGQRPTHEVRGMPAGNDVVIDHRFHVGSCTKAMTATMIATLIDQGAIKWETTIIEVFPELKGKINVDYEQVTLRQLLTHAGGIVAATGGNSPESAAMRTINGSPQEQRAAMLEVILNFNPVATPGEKMSYSNAGYGIAAAMVERRTGAAWEQLMTDKLFVPLVMTQTGFGWPATLQRSAHPLGHSVNAEGKLVSRPVIDSYKLTPPIAPAGDVHCSIEDFARFAQLHLKKLREQSPTFLMLHEPAKSSYACGWVRRDIAGQPAHWHNGSAGTFFAWMTLWPERNLAIVVATNAGTGEKACEEATNKLFTKFAQEPPRLPVGEEKKKE